MDKVYLMGMPANKAMCDALCDLIGQPRFVPYKDSVTVKCTECGLAVVVGPTQARHLPTAAGVLCPRCLPKIMVGADEVRTIQLTDKKMGE